jgi:hypothetical protein
VEAAQARGMPLKVLDVQADRVPPAYRHKLVIVRGDEHVAWRGDSVAEIATALVATLCATSARR